MSKRRSNISAALRRRRALRVAVGVHRFEWRALDCSAGRPSVSFPRETSTEAEALRFMHEWLLSNRPASPSWWFHVRELAYDEHCRFHVVVKSWDVLVYRDTLFDAFRRPFSVPKRREAVSA